MADNTGLTPISSFTSLAQERATNLINKSLAKNSSNDSTKIEKSARDFESILLGQWLEQAQKTFATVPGAEDDEDADPGQSQFQSLGMQSLATNMTASGGIGIAKLIARQLHAQAAKTEDPGKRPDSTTNQGNQR